MVRVKYVIVFWYAIGNILFYCASIQFQNQNLYGSMTNAYPKSSCLRINNIHLVIHCLQTCMTNVGIYFISSYNRKQQACLCCSDYSGSDITDPSWNTYEMSKYSPILSFPFQRWFFVQGGGGGLGGWVGYNNYIFWGDYNLKIRDICHSCNVTVLRNLFVSCVLLKFLFLNKYCKCN